MPKCMGLDKSTETMYVTYAVGYTLTPMMSNVKYQLFLTSKVCLFILPGCLQSVVIDGISMGCPCCSHPDCNNDLESV